MAGDENPFDSGRTVILPTPGGTVPPNASQPMMPGQAPQNSSAGSSALSLPKIANSLDAEDNIVLGSCLSVISYAAELRHIHDTPNTQALFAEMVNEIQQIGEQLRQAGKTDDIIISARYLVCSFIDEMILNTPWGSVSNWSTRSLLSHFHKESQGGTKFFEILKKIEQQSARYIELIELAYVCLSYGYLGMFRVQADGQAHIENIKENLFRHISQFKQTTPGPLSSKAEGIDTGDNTLQKGKALILTSAVALTVLIATFVWFLMSINKASDPVTKQAWELHSKLPSLIEKERQVISSHDYSALFAPLQNDINAGKLNIASINGGYMFTLYGQGLFGSGSANITNVSLIDKVANVIAQIPGSISVIGHSDDIPIRTVEFPSNMQLSKKRAESIANKIKSKSAQRSISVEGLADLEPLVPNNSSANRAKNRRVEIKLFSN